MMNAMQLKAKIKKIAKENKTTAQLVLQNYTFERFLERISQSQYNQNIILKGGLLISAMVGIDTRSTMDMDATIKRLEASEVSIQNMIKDICTIPIDDGFQFLYKTIGQIRNDDEYGGFRVTLLAQYSTIEVVLKLDITTGDKITPKEITYDYPLLFEDRTITIFAYNIETVLAEKLETILSRADQNTRPRDFYDVHALTKLYGNEVNIEVLKKSLTATAKKRGSLIQISNYVSIMTEILNSETMNNLWELYRKDYIYAENITFKDVCNSTSSLLSRLM